VSFPKIQQLSGQIAVHLRDQILTGQLRPETFIRPHVLAEQFATSVTPVREALFVLKHEGFVGLSPRRGFVVKPISTQDIIDMFRLQAYISGEIARRAALQITQPQLDDLRSIQERYIRAIEAGDDEAMYGRNHDFHKNINLAANAPKLALAFVNAARYTPRQFFAGHEAFFDDSVDEHQRMIDALALGDPEVARSEMVRHVGRASEIVERRFQNGTSMAMPIQEGLSPGFTARTRDTAEA